MNRELREDGDMLAGAILAGGQNRRMGGNAKALLDFGGEPMIVRQIRRMAAICSEIVVVTSDPGQLAPVVGGAATIVPDAYPRSGPLAGIHAALNAARSEYIWVIGCDMPFPSTDTARYLLELARSADADAAVPLAGGRLQPLHAIYRKTCAHHAETLLRERTFKLMELFRRIRWEQADEAGLTARGIDPRFAVNTNTPEEWAEAMRLDDGKA